MSDSIKRDGHSGPTEVSSAASRERDFRARIAALEAGLDAINAKYDYVENWFANLLPTDWDKCMERWAEESAGH